MSVRGGRSLLRGRGWLMKGDGISLGGVLKARKG